MGTGEAEKIRRKIRVLQKSLRAAEPPQQRRIVQAIIVLLLRIVKLPPNNPN